MKKYLIGILSVVCCLCAAFAIGCKTEKKENLYDVEFTVTEGVEYTCSELGDKPAKGGKFSVKPFSEIEFTITFPDDKDAAIKANGTAVAGNAQGVYTVNVSENVTISATLTPHVMSGSGSETSPYIITRVSDLLTTAERVNEGVTSYMYGFFELGADIDVKGGELLQIGDGSTITLNGSEMDSFFAGHFDGKGHTISNFKIESNTGRYAGLFANVQSSGQDLSSAVITNLNLDSFEIDAYKPSGADTYFVGSFIGSGVASTLAACSATNGDITVHTDNTASVFAGGAIGVQQSFYFEENGIGYPLYATTDYVHTSVNIWNGSGRIYAAGGIAGYLFTMTSGATSSVVNCYAEGSVLASAMRSGGVVGLVGSDSSVANTYFTGEVSAYATSVMADEQYDAYAGGIIGYADTDSVVSDSFSVGSVTANAEGYAKTHTGNIIGGKAPATDFYASAVEFNCYSGDEVSTTAEFYKKLGWRSCDWVMNAGEYPVINYDTVENDEFRVYYDLGGKSISGAQNLNYTVQIGSGYHVPLAYYIAITDEGAVMDDPAALLADDRHLSYGAYFDAAHTLKVPVGYIVTREITLYIAFADPAEVAGTYYMIKDGRVSTLVLDAQGGYSFESGIKYPVVSDGVYYPTLTYVYDGQKIVLGNGLFGRISDYRDPDHPENNYGAGAYIATKTADGSLEIYDGTFFTAENPLVAVKTAPVADHDAFFGNWEKSANINKKFTFGDGVWSYSFKGETKEGTYTLLSDGTATLALNGGGTFGSAKVTAGWLAVTENGKTEELYCRENSYNGTWYDLDRNTVIYLDGFGSSLGGSALCYINGLGYELSYVADGYFDTDGRTTVTLLSGYSLFGYLYLENGVLCGSMYDSSAGGLLDGYKMYLVDSYDGEWIGDNGGELINIIFNGYGIYDVAGGENISEVKGWVTVDGERLPYSVNLENGSSATFTYKGAEYILSYDDVLNKVTLSGAGDITATELERKDEWAEFSLIDGDGNIYEFDGGGNLAIGGKLKVTSAAGEDIAVFGYKTTGSGIDENLDRNGNNAGVYLTLFEGGNEVGSVTIEKYKFKISLQNGASAQTLNGRLLNINTPFTGIWAVSTAMNNFEVGTIDLSYRTSGKFMDMETDATYYYDRAANMLRFNYISSDTSSGFSSVPFNILYLQEGNLAISPQTYLTSDALYCTPQDDMYGLWSNATTGVTLRFDGLSKSKYVNGIAQSSDGSLLYLYVSRFGRTFIWEYDPDAESEEYMEIVDTRLNEDVYTKGGRKKQFVAFDDTKPIYTAKSADNKTYAIYLDGSVEVDGVKCTYLIDDFTDTATTVEITKPDGSKFRVEIDYSDRNNVTAKTINA